MSLFRNGGGKNTEARLNPDFFVTSFAALNATISGIMSRYFAFHNDTKPAQYRALDAGNEASTSS